MKKMIQDLFFNGAAALVVGTAAFVGCLITDSFCPFGVYAIWMLLAILFGDHSHDTW